MLTLRRVLYSGIILHLLLSVSCGDQVNIPNDVHEDFGTVFMNIDKEAVPVNVSYLAVTLTSDAHSPMTEYFSVGNDSSAVITVTQIPAGIWLLTVEAFDVDSVLQYEGETYVTVISGYHSQISLTLMPARGSSRGIIKIYAGSENFISYFESYSDIRTYILRKV